CTERMAEFYGILKSIRSQVSDLANGCEPHLATRLEDILGRIDAYEPSVTLVGQVKAGKTALTNVLGGQIGLLPSDVNPLTSVVTNVHLNIAHQDGRTKAAFQLFGPDEWANLLEGGGRLGQMADRAGAKDDLENLQRQTEEMRAAARKRLGKSFEALLGKVHNYGYCDADLVERYVCLGDPDEVEDDPFNTHGRFADITKSADLHLSQPNLPGPLCLRDTPGVNDTLLVREQTTLQALADTEVCVIVLSAHEAMNTADLALVRLIASMDNRQLVLFVNRVDELARPSEQIPEIRASIQKTLSAVDAVNDTAVLFGSARWGEVALARDFGEMDEDQRDALFDWAAASGLADAEDAFEFTWLLSGIPDLMTVLFDRIVEKSGQRLIDSVRGRLMNVINEVRAQEEVDAAAQPLPDGEEGLAQLAEELDEIVEANCEVLDDVIERLIADLHPRLHRVEENYVVRATEALVANLNESSRGKTWTFGSTGLRFVLKSIYARFADAATIEIEDVYSSAAKAVQDMYVLRLAVRDEGFSIEPPQVPDFPPPVVLSQTIAVDLGGNWWKRWWQRRRGMQHYSDDYARLVRAEVGTIIGDLEAKQFNHVLDEMRAVLRAFLSEQKEKILHIAASAAQEPSAADAEDTGQAANLINTLDRVIRTLDGHDAAA
ncbi:MAG: dynamin family protein, partial [Albidovulum sp.]|uniref:dynamin family protein n=1 Tax=Albidovulum sp. TaxID=1872424 RepID=UPI003C9DE1E2